ncbi:M1 family metallopeptidase [Streptomyces albireticuli]|uniref:M1 family metallopeptidase n=1 Tax=Streptomyces albireticuli TaxID=1940 RepID=UPI001B80549B|nr:M1 family metallopeptidase [Streptomyces albireticuli]MCD9145588.1 M1 family metallopeptidase [Streptomyces albireticuli]MCD9165122.1 M1 family metallopeptidase [Streptomyces albireticuli]MCD9195651.1 M1 family metallopeptidase [Streptomyces albireticuli]
MPHTPGRRSPIPWRSASRRAALAAAVSALLLGAAAPPSATSQGIGDRLFPELGNPGFDVIAYDIAFTYHGNDKPLDAVTTLQAEATDRLERFNLDFAGGTVRSVTVNGLPAEYTPVKEDLAVTPAVTLPDEGHFTVTVHHTSDPRVAGSGWVPTSDGLVMANQADAGHRVFPGNDHPSDKARFTFRVTAPKDLTVVANGLPDGRSTRGAQTTWAYRSPHPMATELAQVSIGRSAVARRTGPHGLPLRDVVPAADSRQVEKWTARTPAHLTWMERKVGPYPFETYGVLLADASTGFELETQTLSLFERDLFTRTDIPDWYLESIMVHELAHQWFGDSVSPRAWSDLWLNEAHATWYEALYAEEKGGRRFTTRMRSAYEQSDTWRADGGPPAAPKVPQPGRKTSIFRPNVYDGGAVVLYALRQKIGAPAFERLEREWVAGHRDSTAGTTDFVALASQVSGQDLTQFLRAWLYEPTTPPMPGHPDWKPVSKSA